MQRFLTQSPKESDSNALTHRGLRFLCLTVACTLLFIIVFLAMKGKIHAWHSARERDSQKITIDQSNVDNSQNFTRNSNPCDKSFTVESNERRTVNKQGISFAYDRSLASEVKIRFVTPIILERDSDKPDSVTPKHVAFSFVGPYAKQHENSFFQPEIHIYPIEEYKQALAASPEDIQELESIIQRLSAMLVSSNGSINKQDRLPFLPYGIDASQEFHVHLKYLSFEQGQGIAFLTQYNIEPALINNDGLIYTFQGLTYDRRYYIVATFPVSALFLPNTYDAISTEGYEMRYPQRSQDWTAFDENYKHYVSRIANKLERLPANRFLPSLTTFDRIIQSLCVSPQP